MIKKYFNDIIFEVFGDGFMNLYKTAMILRYGKYNLADLKQEVIKDRIVLSSTYLLSLLLFFKTHDPNLLSLLSIDNIFLFISSIIDIINCII